MKRDCGTFLSFSPEGQRLGVVYARRAGKEPQKRERREKAPQRHGTKTQEIIDASIKTFQEKSHVLLLLTSDDIVTRACKNFIEKKYQTTVKL